ncbi:hypothetical protein [Microcoleus sp. FACHB-672]|uniref:hypothetical protein n=1 Tax=Microcoleus sp. FACHB-672 TaxID=2692825 RepID=UPI00168A2A33|nr:hypothetical protein [Microcoleus sp. FACHB-672]MBD2042411.1 hypothetical protein [Microcoleus sp. FACHB-672]
MSMSPEQFPQSPDSAASDPNQPDDLQATNPPSSLSPADASSGSDSEMTASAESESAGEGTLSPAGAPPDSDSEMTASAESESAGEGTLLSSQTSPPSEENEGDDESSSNSALAGIRQQPIPPPSEPMQYRAIGLIQGRYIASADQFTQGILLTTDGTVIDAVLLGRIMSLVKNHLNLEQEHLWVVYPRTRQKDGNLHAQIVGVWEPETLASGDLAPAGDAPVEPAPQPMPVADGYFSVRGEVIYQSQEQEYIVIKIRQAPRKEADETKFFKLKLNGTLAGKAVGHFWDLQVHRQAEALVIQESNNIGPLPGKPKRPGTKPFRKGRPGGGNSRSASPSPRRPQSAAASTPPKRKTPVSKPIIKRPPPNEPPPES